MKKTINISIDLINRLLISMIITVLIVMLGHFYRTDWRYYPATVDSSGMYVQTSKVSWCTYKCLFGSRHAGDCSTISVYQIGKDHPSIKESLSASFEHYFLMIIMTILLTALIYLFKNVDFKFS